MSEQAVIRKERLPSPSDWTFELIETYFEEIKKTAQGFGLACAKRFVAWSFGHYLRIAISIGMAGRSTRRAMIKTGVAAMAVWIVGKVKAPATTRRAGMAGAIGGMAAAASMARSSGSANRSARACAAAA